MLRVLLLSPNGAATHRERDREIAQAAVGSGAEITVRHLPGIPVSAYLPAEDVLLSPLLAAVRQGDDDGFDAIGIACASDPGLREAKALVPTPVTGPFEAAVRIAASYGRFSLLYPGVASGPGENLPQSANWARRLAHEYGVTHLFASALPVPVRRPADEVDSGAAASPEEQALITGEQVLAEMTTAIRERGPALAEQAYRADEAEALFVACTFWADQLDPVRAAVPIPVLDPIAGLARYAALLAATGGRR